MTTGGLGFGFPTHAAKCRVMDGAPAVVRIEATKASPSASLRMTEVAEGLWFPTHGAMEPRHEWGTQSRADTGWCRQNENRFESGLGDYEDCYGLRWEGGRQGACRAGAGGGGDGDVGLGYDGVQVCAAVEEPLRRAVGLEVGEA